MKTLRPWLLATAFLYLFFLVWTAPAGLLWSKALARLPLDPSTLQIGSLEGPWTAGKIDALSVAGFRAEEVSWKFKPLTLLLGRLSFSVKCREPALKGSLGISLTGKYFEIGDLQGRIPLASLHRSLPAGNLLKGSLEFDRLEILVSDGYPVYGRGKIIWHQARIAAPYDLSLGGMELDLTPSDKGTELQLKDLGGNLQAVGSGLIDLTGGYSFNGSLAGKAGSPDKLNTMLQVLGRPGADGRIRIEYRGQMSRLF